MDAIYRFDAVAEPERQVRTYAAATEEALAPEIDNLVLAVSEIVTNALNHGRPRSA